MKVVSSLIRGLLQIATALCLAYALFAAGFALCLAPQSTQFIGSTFAGWETAVFGETNMALIAEEVRAFAVDGTTTQELYDAVLAAIQESYPALAQAFEVGEVSPELSSNLQAETGSTSLTALQERYSFAQDAISHLQDCTPIFTTARISLGVVFATGLIGLAVTWVIAGRKQAGRALMLAGALVLGVLILLGVWAFVDFNGLFTFVHSLFFAGDSWIFSSDSLLIQLFPQAFWAAMVGLWVLVNVVLSTLALIVGKLIKFGT